MSGEGGRDVCNYKIVRFLYCVCMYGICLYVFIPLYFISFLFFRAFPSTFDISLYFVLICQCFSDCTIVQIICIFRDLFICLLNSSPPTTQKRGCCY